MIRGSSISRRAGPGGLAALAIAILSATTAAQDQQTPPKQPLDKGEVARIVDEYLSQRPPAAPSILDDLQVFGDLRLREEYDLERPGKPDRNRLRLRLRLGATMTLSEELELGARLRTGDPDDPNSPHVTFGDVFDSLEINLDRAYLTYRPDWSPGSSLTAGKFNHPFQRNPVYGELVFDADVQPEGLLMAHTHRFDTDDARLRRLTMQAGLYPLIEQGGGDDALLAALELAVAVRVAEEADTTLSVAYYHYEDTSPDGNTTLLADNAGNVTLDTDGDGKPDSFASKFSIVHAIANLTYTGFADPVTLGGEYIYNARAEIDAETGWAIGVSRGNSRTAGDVRTYYQWQVVQRDAVFTPVVQDDFLLATNHRSHVFGVNYQARDDVGIHLWGLVSAEDASSGAGDADRDQWRLRLDVNVKF